MARHTNPAAKRQGEMGPVLKPRALYSKSCAKHGKYQNSKELVSRGPAFETSPNPKTGEVSKMPSETPIRGGARNRSDRESYSLGRTQLENLIAATEHADVIGLPFTRMITIHWERAGVELTDMVKATGRFVDLLTKTLARHGSCTAWLWTHENGHEKGGHCHLLIHVLPDLVPVVTRLQKRWLRSITGGTYKKRVIHSVPIGGRLGLETTNPELHAENVGGVLHYVLKAVDAKVALSFGFKRLEPGGYVIGKRCGTSQNIGAKARRSWAE